MQIYMMKNDAMDPEKGQFHVWEPKPASVDDLEAAGIDISIWGIVIENRDGTKAAAPMRPMLAKGRVRHVGEPVAVVIAETYDQARDAAEMIMFEYEELPVKLDVKAGGPTVHEEATDNMAYDFGLGDEEATEAAF